MSLKNTTGKSKVVSYKIPRDLDIKGHDVMESLQALFDLMQSVTNKMKADGQMTFKEWKLLCQGLNAEQLKLVQASLKREGI
jgi:hypothetical protein